MSRVVGWRTKMIDNLARIKITPFEWGVNDCMLASGSHVQAITGRDLISEHLGKYSSPEEAKEYLQSLGFSNLTQFLQAHFPKEIAKQFMNVGDVCIVQGDPSEGLGQTVGIVLHDMVGVLTPVGYGFIRRTDSRILTAFEVN